MSKLLRPLSTMIMNRRNSPDGHKHRIINNFLPTVIQATKMAGTKAADNIKHALGSKQYNSALISLAQNAKELDERSYLPDHVGGNALETMKTQAKSFDKILKIRLSEMAAVRPSYQQ